MLRSKNTIKLICSSIILMAGTVMAQDLQLTRHTIDSGGAMHCTGGRFELSATIGQPDSGGLTGQNYELSVGFWISIPPGDGNDDGVVGASDHQLFQACLTGPEQGPPAPQCQVFDRDSDGAVALNDYVSLQNFFTGE